MPKPILIVDDSTSLRVALRIALERAGYEVREAADGLEGLKAAQGQRLALVVSDVNMPNLDGLSFARKLKDLPEHRYTPVLMLTTENNAAKMAEGKAAGVKAWMVKPFQPPALLDVVKRLVMP